MDIEQPLPLASVGSSSLQTEPGQPRYQQFHEAHPHEGGSLNGGDWLHLHLTFLRRAGKLVSENHGVNILILILYSAPDALPHLPLSLTNFQNWGKPTIFILPTWATIAGKYSMLFRMLGPLLMRVSHLAGSTSSLLVPRTLVFPRLPGQILCPGIRRWLAPDQRT